jgi:hypothetical protein
VDDDVASRIRQPLPAGDADDGSNTAAALAPAALAPAALAPAALAAALAPAALAAFALPRPAAPARAHAGAGSKRAAPTSTTPAPPQTQTKRMRLVTSSGAGGSGGGGGGRRGGVAAAEEEEWLPLRLGLPLHVIPPAGRCVWTPAEAGRAEVGGGEAGAGEVVAPGARRAGLPMPPGGCADNVAERDIVDNDNYEEHLMLGPLRPDTRCPVCWSGLADIARHVIGCRLTQETRVQSACR